MCGNCASACYNPADGWTGWSATEKDYSSRRRFQSLIVCLSPRVRFNSCTRGVLNFTILSKIAQTEISWSAAVDTILN